MSRIVYSTDCCPSRLSHTILEVLHHRSLPTLLVLDNPANHPTHSDPCYNARLPTADAGAGSRLMELWRLGYVPLSHCPTVALPHAGDTNGLSEIRNVKRKVARVKRGDLDDGKE